MTFETHRTPRGFIRAQFPDRYGAPCSIQESSLADEACIWLGADKGMDGTPSHRMHLTQDMARALIPALECFVRTGHLPEPKAPSIIPEMTDPLGAHWRQPADIRNAPIDDTHVILTKRQFDDLPNYSGSQPSGVYHGKCWKMAVYDWPPHLGGKVVGWRLVWYGVDPNPGFCSNNYRKILVVE